MEQERVLVAGGTGFIGSHIARRLAAEGYQVTALSRRVAGAVKDIPLARGDVRDPGSLAAALHGIRVLVIAVQFRTAPVEQPRRGHTYLATDGQGTVNLVAAAKQAGVRRFIYISGAGTREGQTAPWFKAKLMAERAVRDSGIPFTIFRPSWVYGPEDKSLNRFVGFARLLPFVPVIGSGRTPVQPLHVDDLAEAVALALKTPAALGQTYDIGGPAALTMDEIIRTMLRVTRRSRALLHAPAWFVKVATAPLTLLPAPPFSPAAVDFVLMDEPVDNGPLQRDLGFTPRPLRGGLAYLCDTGHSPDERDGVC
ncbi:MAG: complex I NDUFA9 subunit family protein [Symbiobacteriia bacterium]